MQPTAKKLLKLVYICLSYGKIKSGHFMEHDIAIDDTLSIRHMATIFLRRNEVQQ